jgi:RNA polymerase sigma-70 factor (ECF subfamily)
MALHASHFATRATLGDEYDNGAFEAALVEHMPLARAYARSLSGGREFAEDLAQETLAKAWSARRSFTPGSNFKAWLFVILRNELYSRQRRGWRQAPWNDALGEAIAVPPAQQQWAVELSDTARALRGLSDPQREALILVVVGGLSHDDAAAVIKVPVGTVKSRVGRARKALGKMLNGKKPLPTGRRSPTGDAMNEILGQLNHIGPLAASRVGRAAYSSPAG